MNLIENELKEAEDLLSKSECLYDQKAIDQAIDRVAQEMNEKLGSKNPLLLCVMNGAVIFTGQLATRLTFPLQIDYVHVTRYQGEIEGREIHWVAEPSVDVKDRTIVIVEDILDLGLTLAAVKQHCQAHGAKEVYCAALIDKKRSRAIGGVERCDFTGLFVEDRFLLGYGLDYKGFLRNVPGIYAVKPEYL